MTAFVIAGRGQEAADQDYGDGSQTAITHRNECREEECLSQRLPADGPGDTLIGMNVTMAHPSINEHELERSIREIGEEVFQRAEDAAPSVWSMERWQQSAMEWMTQDEDLKLRLFQFVESLPRLGTSVQVAGRLKELLTRNENGHGPLPAILQFALAYERNDSLFASIVAGTARWGCAQSARQFICGSTPSEAIASVMKLRRQGMAFTVDLLGETVHSTKVARGHLETYLRLIAELGTAARSWTDDPVLDVAPWGPIPKVNVSIKLTALAADVERMDRASAAAAMAEPLRTVLRAAAAVGAFINVDMEHYSIKDLTLEVFKSVLMEDAFSDTPDIGIVIQAYLTDAMKDMHGLIDWSRGRGVPISVRLVKGAYWDSETARAQAEGRPPPVFAEKWQSDASFEQVGRLMIDHADWIRPTIGSHNVRSIAAMLAYSQAMGQAPRTVEVQMLTGMGDPLKRAMVAMKQRLRVYSPVGDLVKGMAYLIRRLIENTSNDSFLRQSFGDGRSVTSLLARPGRA